MAAAVDAAEMATGADGAALSSEGDRTGIFDLPNELLDDIVSRVDSDGANGQRAGSEKALGCLALAQRRFLPFARPHLLRSIKVGGAHAAADLEAMIVCFERPSAEGALVRRLRVQDLGGQHVIEDEAWRPAASLPTTTASTSSSSSAPEIYALDSASCVSQHRLAQLLSLLPSLRELAFPDVKWTRLEPRLRDSLQGLLSLQRVCLGASVQRHRLSTQYFSSILPGLCDRIRLQELRLVVQNPNWTTHALARVQWPTCDIRSLQIAGGPAHTLDALYDFSDATFFARLTALDVPIACLQPLVLNAVAHSLQALAIGLANADETVDRIVEALNTTEMPRLQLLWFKGRNLELWSFRRAFEGRTHRLFLHVQTVLWSFKYGSLDFFLSLAKTYTKISKYGVCAEYIRVLESEEAKDRWEAVREEAQVFELPPVHQVSLLDYLGAEAEQEE